MAMALANGSCYYTGRKTETQKKETKSKDNKTTTKLTPKEKTKQQKTCIPDWMKVEPKEVDNIT